MRAVLRVGLFLTVLATMMACAPAPSAGQTASATSSSIAGALSFANGGRTTSSVENRSAGAV